MKFIEQENANGHNFAVVGQDPLIPPSLLQSEIPAVSVTVASKDIIGS